MATLSEFLAEAKIRDWQRRHAAGDVSNPWGLDSGDSVEGQLFRHVVQLIDEAQSAQGSERAWLERKAREIEIQLMVTLEANGLVLAARRIAEDLEKRRGGGSGA